MANSTLTDGFARSIRISNKRFCSTYFSALFPIADLLREHDLWSPIRQALAKRTQKCKHQSTPLAMFQQRLFALIAGFEDLTDHDIISEDPGFLAALGVRDCPSCATLCRFENSVDRNDIDALNQALLKTLLKIDKVHHVIPNSDSARSGVLILDVDSTHVDLYGNQQGKSYNAHYQCNCLAPVVCFLNGWPVAVFNAPGTMDARAVLRPHFSRLIKDIQTAFPTHKLLLRTDSGFNSPDLMGTCEELGCFYITGLAPNRVTENIAKRKDGLLNPVRKKVKCFTQKGFSYRTLGELVGYKARSWKKERRVIARKQFNPRKNLQADLRLIQTNIKNVGKGESGYCPYYSGLSASDLYEKTYCERGCCELNIEEFKTECFGGRASASRIETNSYRMILAAFCQITLKLVRQVLLGMTKEPSEKKKASVTVRTLRRAFFGITAYIRETKKQIVLTLPSHLLYEDLLMQLLKIPIASQA